MAFRAVQSDELSVPLTPYKDAVELVVDGVKRLAPRTVSVANSDGLVLAQDVVAPFDVPRWDNSSMDGYAIDAAATADAPVIILEIPKIMTGQPLPVGANTVVPWEETSIFGDQVSVNRAFKPGEFVRRAAEDVKQGDLVIKADTELTPTHLGLSAALGQSDLMVYPRPRVTVLCTGDEVAIPGNALGPNQVYDANGPMLAALLRRAGAEVVGVCHVGDDEGETRSALSTAAANSDAVVTTGGASVGEHDWTRAVLTEIGELLLWRVAVRPGRPFAFGRVGECNVFVLPGNPASVLACAHAFALPALRKMAGRKTKPRLTTALLQQDVVVEGERTFLCPIEHKGDQAWPVRAASSSVLSNQLDANGFLVSEPGQVRAGSRVSIELTD